MRERETVRRWHGYGQPDWNQTSGPPEGRQTGGTDGEIMNWNQREVRTNARIQLLDITGVVAAELEKSGVQTGVCHVHAVSYTHLTLPTIYSV